MINVPRSQKSAIWADSLCLAVEIEQAVRGFSRDPKYSVGADLRRQAAHMCQWVAQAARFVGRRARPIVFSPSF